MNSERWRRIEEVYHSALERSPDERAAFLALVCGSDEELRCEVESLLGHAESPEALLDRPAWEAAGDLLDTHSMDQIANLVGQRISHYEVIDKLGEGGMGTVYRAVDTRLGRTVAIKVVKARFTKRFEREARAISALNHPHICTLHDVGEHEGAPYLVMEYVEGRPLKGPMQAREALLYAIQACEALVSAHNAGIVHRDLKPDNILLTSEGSVKVLDFGLAKLQPDVAAATPTATMTEQGVVTGTAPYMSPEQAQGEPVDARSDIFSLGTVLYELLSGRRAFQRETMGATMAAVITSEPPPLREAPPHVARIVGRMLAKKPENRYQSTPELLTELRAAAESGGPRFVLRRFWLAVVAALATLTVALVGLNVGSLRSWLPGGTTTPKYDSLAVLPFANLSGNPAQDYLADGIHESLITDLGEVRGLRKVIARASVTSYRNTGKPLRQVALELGVKAIVTGAVQREGNRVRITVQLINAATGAQLWAARYEREFRDVLSLEDEIVTAITREIRVRLTPQDRARLASARPVNPEAHEAFLKGKFYVNKLTPEGTEKGLAYFRQAIEKDPTHPLPYAMLALAYNELGHSETPPPDAFQQSKALARKSLELDETLAEGHQALAEIKLYTDWGDWAGTGQALRRALELNPNLPEAHRDYSWYLFVTGNPEALAEMRRAQELDPLTPQWTADLAYQYWCRGQYDKAIEEARKSVEVDPDFSIGFWVLGEIWADRGMYKEAIAANQKASAASPAFRWALGRTYALAGRREEARKIAAEVAKTNLQINTWGLAELYATLGDKDEALRWLEAAYKVRWSWMPWIQQVPPFRPLHGDPRFEDLVRRMNLPVE